MWGQENGEITTADGAKATIPKKVVYICTTGESGMRETFDDVPFTVRPFVHPAVKCRIEPSTHIPLKISNQTSFCPERLS